MGLITSICRSGQDLSGGCRNGTNTVLHSLQPQLFKQKQITDFMYLSNVVCFRMAQNVSSFVFCLVFYSLSRMQVQVAWTYSNTEAQQLETLQALKLPTAPGPGRTTQHCTELFPEQHIK